MPAERIKSYLDKQNVKYVTIQHSPAYTAQEIAQTAHIPGKALAKPVIVKIQVQAVVVQTNRKWGPPPGEQKYSK